MDEAKELPSAVELCFAGLVLQAELRLLDQADQRELFQVRFWLSWLDFQAKLEKERQDQEEEEPVYPESLARYLYDILRHRDLVNSANKVHYQVVETVRRSLPHSTFKYQVRVLASTAALRATDPSMLQVREFIEIKHQDKWTFLEGMFTWPESGANARSAPWPDDADPKSVGLLRMLGWQQLSVGTSGSGLELVVHDMFEDDAEDLVQGLGLGLVVRGCEKFLAAFEKRPVRELTGFEVIGGPCRDADEDLGRTLRVLHVLQCEAPGFFHSVDILSRIWGVPVSAQVKDWQDLTWIDSDAVQVLKTSSSGPVTLLECTGPEWALKPMTRAVVRELQARIMCSIWEPDSESRVGLDDMFRHENV